MINFTYMANLQIAAALAAWALGLWGIVNGQEEILKYLYFFAWYPYVLFLDGLLCRLKGNSWLLGRPREFLKMFFWSTGFGGPGGLQGRDR
ncbi:MAG: hypothetical protein P8168_14675 [Deltaproteobacteria bacterium]